MGYPAIESWRFLGGGAQGKRVDELIPAFEKLSSETEDLHLVLLMPQECSPKSYVEQIDDLLKKISPERYSIIRNFDAELPQLLLEYEYLDTVIFASRFEGAPLTPMEAVHFGHDKLKILYHKIPPLSDILAGKPYAFAFSRLNAETIFQAWREVNSKVGTSIGNRDLSSFSDNMATGMDCIL